METSAISYRVADFLKKHPPFHAVPEADLIQLAANGRVRFHEPNDYILWQGEPHRPYVYVIQQGTVSLWDDAGNEPVLRDVRGAGDLLGIERFSGARSTEYSARSSSDVVIYAFDAYDFETLVLKVPYAARYVEAYGSVTAEYHRNEDTQDPQKTFLHSAVSRATLHRCAPDESIRRVAQLMTELGAEAVAVVDGRDRLLGLATTAALIAWIAGDGADPGSPVSRLLTPPTTVAPDASTIDGVLAMAEADASAIAVTDDGTREGRLQAVVSQRDLVRVFGDQPSAILHDIRRAATTVQLRDLNHRARACALPYFAGVAAVEWLTRFMELVDAAIFARVVSLAGAGESASCWCFAGAAGRRESLTRHIPQVVMIAADDRAVGEYARVLDALAECDYLPRTETGFERAFFAAPAAEWQGRYDRWIRDPIFGEMYLARQLFDLRPIHGPLHPWSELAASVAAATDQSFVQILANDCLSSLPPLTFYEDAVVDDAGEHTAIFKLEHSALQPLVDVGRVFGIAVRKVFGTSTNERFRLARTLVPEHEEIFREAAATLTILLAQQARVGISQNTRGSELPPALLSRHDRQLLKSGFRSIHRLLEFTADSPWLTQV
jgi:CBS domain-containing protein